MEVVGKMSLSLWTDLSKVMPKEKVPVSILMKPATRMAHSVTTTVIIMVRATAEKPCRFRNVIRNPNPPNSIMCTSRITANALMVTSLSYRVIHLP